MTNEKRARYLKLRITNERKKDKYLTFQKKGGKISVLAERIRMEEKLILLRFFFRHSCFGVSGGFSRSFPSFSSRVGIEEMEYLILNETYESLLGFDA